MSSTAIHPGDLIGGEDFILTADIPVLCEQRADPLRRLPSIGQFRKLGWGVSDSTLAAAIGAEIDRLSREAATLRKLRAALFSVA